MSLREIEIVAGSAELFRRGAEEFVRASAAAVAEAGRFTVALSGGSTPKGLFGLLANEAALRDAVAWDKIDFFWGDERHVPPDHPDSNYRMSNEALLSKVPIDLARVHRIEGELADTEEAAQQY